ncbi:MAG: 16S rRNA (guanine(966)-N(2))-methyltransferase RsmD [Peptococcaceae bacterium]|nr:16S rRNA (guanine(966)-N(2))-methyltransferase RsmD [Peptococcaceae bacterium]
MRIIAGELRGRRIQSVQGWKTRPTSDKVKGAIFNVLRDKVRAARVLDLFAGTGNLALEALSRGARHAVLLEDDRAACRVIRENARSLGLERQTEVIPLSVFVFLPRCRAQAFDLIFLDPPYRQGWASQAVAQIAQLQILTRRGVIVAETARDELLEPTEQLQIRQRGSYGDTQIWYLQWQDEKQDLS